MLFTAAVLLCTLATGLAQLTIPSSDGSATYTCPNSITPELVYSTAVQAQAGGYSIVNDEISFIYAEGSTTEGRAQILAQYEGLFCVWSKTSDETSYEVLAGGEECGEPSAVLVPTGSLSRRTALHPSFSKRSINFPTPQFVCPLGVATAIYRRGPGQDPTSNGYAVFCFYSTGMSFCQYSYATGELLGIAQASSCPASLCPAVYSQKRSLEDAAITRRQLDISKMRSRRPAK